MSKFKHLDLEQRYQIAAFLKIKMKQMHIAMELGVDPGTISRELRRNKGKRGYSATQAHALALTRKKDKKVNKKLVGERVLKIVELLNEDWSPEQISGDLKKKGQAISHEAIYQFIDQDKKSGGTLYKHLRCKKKRKKRYGSNDRRGMIKNRVSIEQRPAVVESRSRLGDWEADTVIGKNHKGVLVTLVERKTRYTIVRHVESKKAQVVKNAIVKALSPIKNFVKTITFDNGKEFAYHEAIASELETKCYFAHPYHSWERGTNENTNGLIRQYFPKSQDLRKVSRKDTDYVMKKLNTRPRKILNFERPFDQFIGHMLLVKLAGEKIALAS